jgi:P27 family predicted phage terminase small subunit
VRGSKKGHKALLAHGQAALGRRITTTDPPAAPEFLDQNAKGEWDRIVPALARLGLATDVDVAMLATYCTSYSTWKQAVLTVQTEGQTVVTSKGDVRTHPCVHIADSAAAEMRRLAQEFGFTPASRARIEAPPSETEETDAFNDFFHGGEVDSQPVG